MQFELASCVVELNIHQHVPKPSVTPPELHILRMMHVQNRQDNPVKEFKFLRNIVREKNKETGKMQKVDKGQRFYETSPLLEIQRLRAKYGTDARTKKHWVDELYPGAVTNPSLLPTKFEQVKWLPAEVRGTADAPSRMLLPGEPGYEEPTAGEENEQTVMEVDGMVVNKPAEKWTPPVSEDAEPAEPSPVNVSEIAKETVAEMSTAAD